MKISQSMWTKSGGWQVGPGASPEEADLVLAFGATGVLDDAARISEVRARFPAAHVVGCSTAGEIQNTQVTDDTLVVTAVEFERGVTIKPVSVSLDDVGGCSHRLGVRLAERLPVEGLAHVFVLSCGLNGSELTRGLVESLPSNVGITGGLSGDGARFARTLVWLDDAVSERTVRSATRGRRRRRSFER